MGNFFGLRRGSERAWARAACLPIAVVMATMALAGCGDDDDDVKASPAPMAPVVSGPYTVGGTVAGLNSGSQLVLHNNDQDGLTLTADGSFTFATPVAHNGHYAVTVAAQPPGQVCSVAGGTGAGMTAPVSNVAVVCATTRFKVGGSVSGLASGKQVTLQNNGADALVINGNGGFTFTTPVPYNGNYLVTVSAQPPGQTCTVNGHAGSAVAADIDSIEVVCAASTYSVGGSLTGLTAGKQITLANNGGDYLTLTGNGLFRFATPLADGGTYAITVGTQPPGQSCVISNGTGTAAANVSNVAVQCTSLPIGTLYAPSNNSTATYYYSILSDGQLLLAGQDYAYSGVIQGMAYADSLQKLYFSSDSGWTYNYDVAQGGSLTIGGTFFSQGGETPSAMLRDPLGRFLLVGSANAQRIRTYIADAAGALTPGSAIATTVQPRSMVMTPNGLHLYAGSAAGAGMDVFNVAADGSPTYRSTAAYGASVAELAMHPSGNFLYVADAVGNLIRPYDIDAAGNPLPQSPVIATGSAPAHLIIDPTGRYLYVISQASNEIWQFTIAADGTPMPMTPSRVGTGTLAGKPSFDPTGRFLYVPSGAGMEIRQYAVGVTGALTPLAPASVATAIPVGLVYAVPR